MRNLKGELLCLKTENIKPNFSELSRIYSIDRRTIKKQYLRLIKDLDKKKILYYSCIKELNVYDNKLYFLNNKDYGNENDNSAVIYTELNNYKFLFMEDIGDDEHDIIKNIGVLKVANHDSRTRGVEESVNCIRPKYSKISVENNILVHRGMLLLNICLRILFFMI